MMRLVIAVLMASLALPALAAPLDDVRAGVAAARQGKREEAIRLLTRALEAGGLSKDNQSIALLNRGYTLQRGGEIDGAIDDYNAAIRLTPDSQAGYRNRASAYLEAGSYNEAAADFARALTLPPSNTYMALWLHIARLRGGEDDTQELAANVERLDLAPWPGPVFAYIAGLGSREAAESAAADDAHTRASRQCDFAFHVGVHELVLGERESLRLLREARDKCSPESVERAVARAELVRFGR